MWALQVHRPEPAAMPWNGWPAAVFMHDFRIGRKADNAGAHANIGQATHSAGIDRHGIHLERPSIASAEGDGRTIRRNSRARGRAGARRSIAERRGRPTVHRSSSLTEHDGVAMDGRPTVVPRQIQAHLHVQRIKRGDVPLDRGGDPTTRQDFGCNAGVLAQHANSIYLIIARRQASDIGPVNRYREAMRTWPLFLDTMRIARRPCAVV